MKASPPLYYHILLFISLFIIFQLWDIGINHNVIILPLPEPVIWFSISYLTAVFAAYCLSFYLFCPWLYQRKYLFYLASVPLTLLFFVALRYLLEEVIIFDITGLHNYAAPSRKATFYIRDNFFFGLPCVIISTLSFLFWQFLHYQKRNQQLQLENQKAQFDLLKSQVSPHFLFNTLNAFYSDWVDKDPDTAADLLTLTHLLRYVITENDKDYVLLSGELEFLKNYFKLQQKRFEDQLFLEFSISGNCAGQAILPSVLVQFAENMFKYGRLNEPSKPAVFAISIAAGTLVLETSNLIIKGGNYDATGTGLSNLKKRLAYAYQNGFILNKVEKKDTFVTYLKIPLQTPS